MGQPNRPIRSFAIAADHRLRIIACLALSVIAPIDEVDADVVSTEAARSRVERLDAFSSDAYLGGIGPGDRGILAPRIPTVEDMITLLTAAAERRPHGRLRVNSHGGPKTCAWAQVRAAAVHLIAEAAR